MRNLLFLVLFLLPVFALAQFPNSPNKMRLGFQTTGDGLVYRGAGAPGYTPTTINNAWMYLDTVAKVVYAYQGGVWHALAGSDGNGIFDAVNEGDTIRVTTTYIDPAGWSITDTTSTINFAVNSASATLFAGNAGVQAVKPLGYLLMQGDSLLFSIGGSFGNAGQVITATGDGGAFWQDLPAGADDWGTQVVEKDSTLRGNGTLADPLRVNRDTFATRAEVAQALADSVAARPTGTGTTNALAKWLSSTSLGNSLLSDDGSRITAGGTAGFVLPVGTTAQRSGAPVAGETRVNSTNSNTMEWYTGTAWEVPIRAASVTGLGTSNRIGNYDANGRLASSNAVVINGSLNNAELYSASSTRSGGGHNHGIVWGQNLSLTVSSGTYTTYLMGQYMTMSQGGQTNRSTFYFGGGTSTATYTALERTFGVGLESQVPTFSVNYGDGQTDATRRGFVVVGSNGNTDATGRDWGGTLSVTGIPEYSSTNYASTLNATVNPTTAVIIRNSANTAIAPHYHRFGLGTKMKVLGNEYLLTGRDVNNGWWNFTPALDSGLFQQITIVPHIQQWYKADKQQAAVIDNNGNLYVGSTIQFTPDKLTVAGTARVTGSSTLPAASVTGRDSLGVFRDVTIGSGLSFSEGTLSATGGTWLKPSLEAGPVTINPANNTLTFNTIGAVSYDPVLQFNHDAGQDDVYTTFFEAKDTTGTQYARFFVETVRYYLSSNTGVYVGNSDTTSTHNLFSGQTKAEIHGGVNGHLEITGGYGKGGKIRLKDNAFSDYVQITVPDDVTTSYSIVLPATGPTAAGQTLVTTNSSGTTTWSGVAARGSVTDTTDGSGDITISQTMPDGSFVVTVSAVGTTPYILAVHTKTASNFKVRVFDATGAAVTATSVTIDWSATDN